MRINSRIGKGPPIKDARKICEVKNHQLQYIFILLGVMILTVIEQLNALILNQMWTSTFAFIPPPQMSVCVHFCLTVLPRSSGRLL